MLTGVGFCSASLWPSTSPVLISTPTLLWPFLAQLLLQVSDSSHRRTQMFFTKKYFHASWYFFLEKRAGWWGGGIYDYAKGLRIHIAQFPPEFVWCCLQDPPAPPGSRADCRICTGKAPGRKLWGMWPEKWGGLSEQLTHRHLVVSGQSSCLMAVLGFSYGARAEVVLQATLLSFSRTSSKFLSALARLRKQPQSSLEIWFMDTFESKAENAHSAFESQPCWGSTKEVWKGKRPVPQVRPW